MMSCSLTWRRGSGWGLGPAVIASFCNIGFFGFICFPSGASRMSHKMVSYLLCLGLRWLTDRGKFRSASACCIWECPGPLQLLTQMLLLNCIIFFLSQWGVLLFSPEFFKIVLKNTFIIKCTILFLSVLFSSFTETWHYVMLDRVPQPNFRIFQFFLTQLSEPLYGPHGSFVFASVHWFPLSFVRISVWSLP